MFNDGYAAMNGNTGNRALLHMSKELMIKISERGKWILPLLTCVD